MLVNMGYTDKLQKLCALRGLDQSSLAKKVGLSRSSISRILNGAQEPKLKLAYELARALGVSLDYLVDENPDLEPSDQLVMLSESELTILKIVRHLGTTASIDRLLNSSGGTVAHQPDSKPVSMPMLNRPRLESPRTDKPDR